MMSVSAMDAQVHAYKPIGAVQSILGEQLLQQQLPESHFKDLRALPKKFSNTKASKHEGKIRVNKEVHKDAFHQQNSS